jgi:hypothetical protein
MYRERLITRPMSQAFVIKKVKFLCAINWAPRHIDVLGSGSIGSPLLTSTVGGSEWSASRRGRPTPSARAPGTHFIGDREGPRACLDTVEYTKISCLYWKLNLSNAARRYNDWTIPAHLCDNQTEMIDIIHVTFRKL